jgi:hypothetical protein
VEHPPGLRRADANLLGRAGASPGSETPLPYQQYAQAYRQRNLGWFEKHASSGVTWRVVTGYSRRPEGQVILKTVPFKGREAALRYLRDDISSWREIHDLTLRVRASSPTRNGEKTVSILQVVEGRARMPPKDRLVRLVTDRVTTRLYYRRDRWRWTTAGWTLIRVDTEWIDDSIVG